MALSEPEAIRRPQQSRELPFPLDVLRPTERQDLLGLGINPIVVKSVDRKRIGIAEIPTGYFVEMSNNEHTLRGHIYAEVDLETGDENNTWTGRVFFFPQDAVKNGEAVEIPSFAIDEGYQILVHTPNDSPDKPFTVRMDSVCKTSMYDGGHVSSAGNPDLGCDCLGQRDEGKRIILESPKGLSILSPMEGRGNGQRVHVQQIQMQNFMARTGQEILDTYQTVEALGHKKDSRPDLYFIEALILSELFGIGEVRLLSNNEDKANPLKNAGIKVTLDDIVDKKHPNYYMGINAEAKAKGGHTGLARAITLFQRRG